MRKFGKHLLGLLAGLPRLRGYRNSRAVLTIGGQPLTVEDIIKAAVVSGLAVLLISGTGDAWRHTAATPILDRLPVQAPSR